MTTEEKAKAYDESIGRAKEMIKAMTNIGGVAKVDDIQYLFPELKESEDEKIRKFILEIIKACDGMSNSTKEKCISYLEKQKDNKFAPRVLPCSAAWFEDGEEKQKECGEANFREGYLHGFEDAQKEQKPAEWSEDDKFKLEDAITGIDAGIGFYETEGKHPNLLKAIIEGKKWLKSLHERFNLQPKNGWSEEDKETIDLTIAVLKENLPNGYFKTNPANTLNMGAIHTDELITRLKSLRPQPKKELSIEKAIKWLDDTFYFLDNSSGRGRDCEITTHDFDSLEEMYDSFRKAVIVDSESHWKPSEEQKPEAKLTGWVARDEDEKIWVYETCPKKYSEWQQWVGNYGSMRLDEKSFPDIKWETGPVEVEITIKKK